MVGLLIAGFGVVPSLSCLVSPEYLRWGAMYGNASMADSKVRSGTVVASAAITLVVLFGEGCDMHNAVEKAGKQIMETKARWIQGSRRPM